MQRISSLIRADREFLCSVDAMREAYAMPTPYPMVINGLSGGALDAYVSEAVLEAREILVSGNSKAPVLVILPTDEEAQRVTELLCSIGLKSARYKLREPVFHNISASHDVDRERLFVLNKILRGELDAVVTTPMAAMSYTMPKKELERLSLSIKVGDEMAPDALARRLVELSFAEVESVESAGQFSRRGGILDFFGADMSRPVRVEYFGDEVDRMVYFDPITQRSQESCDSVELFPAREIVLSDTAISRILSTVCTLLENKELSEEMRGRLLREKAALESGVGIDFRDKYMGIVFDECASLLSYFDGLGRGFVFISGTLACKEAAEARCKRLENDRVGMISVGAVSARAAGYSDDMTDYESFLVRNLTVHVNPFAGGIGNGKLSGLFGFRCRRTVSYGGNMTMLVEDLESLRRASYRVLILSESVAGAQSLLTELSDRGFSAAAAKEDSSLLNMPLGSILVGVGECIGFDLVGPKLAVLSMAQDKGRAVMARRRQQRVLKRVGGAGKRLMSHADLSVGDYVVHANYGIGLFEGIQTVTVDGVTKDYITIRYAGTDKLFVPCDRLELIGKYIGDRDRDGGVKLSRMGGTEWARTKSRAKAAAQDIAKNLIALYAERQRRPGFAFPKGCELEDEFDADFEYEETDSQLVAIKEIKEDMMRPVPMNRLLCGDVGFGKTEVALRAAFKAVLGCKQVAILVPTTILALQHYQTAISRMRGYAVNVEMLSRFRKPAKRAEIIKRTERGEIDILIGTHALLSKNVKFKDLGLLIVDEEQRFGVVQKERLREIARNVDTLMLSATPIPRTLNMAMSGISDISVLDEAPGERRPVQTYVLEHDDGLIFDAIRREIDRGGQVLYLYNKVETISFVAGKIAEALPDARITFAHGQMDKEELEDIWHMLVSGEVDVLVCTTIIETGVDLPNANTLVIENADQFGLSQLHQIRGRVGRSERQAYAYFTYRPGKALSEVAEKRLEAIREFAEFGAGFKIALRDLEIRGAGNLLGAEQHGYIESVGYDLYLKLLNEAVLEQNGQAAEARFESTVAINVTAHIPESYISSSAHRMEMYKRISQIECEEDAIDVTDELTDRFGDMPRAVESLVNVSVVRALAEQAKIKKVEAKDMRLTFISEKPDLAVWSELFARFGGLSFLGVGSPIVVYRLKRGDDPTLVARQILSQYVKVANDRAD